jgi:hypothetical protein
MEEEEVVVHRGTLLFLNHHLLGTHLQRALKVPALRALQRSPLHCQWHKQQNEEGVLTLLLVVEVEQEPSDLVLSFRWKE